MTPLVITGTGVGLIVFLVGEWTFMALQPGLRLVTPVHVVGLVTSAPFILALVYGGWHLSRGSLPPARYHRIAGWTLAGLLTFLVMNLLTMVSLPPENVTVMLGWLRWAAAIGAGVGLLIGVTEARAIERERAAERAATRAEYAEAQRKQFEYLNGLLRHEVLNTVNVISGGTAVVLENSDLDETSEEWLERIASQSEEMAGVIQDVNILLEAGKGAEEFEPTALVPVLREELLALDNRFDSVQTDLSAPDDVTVSADGLLPRLFSNLLSNAVEHNDGEDPSVHLTVETAGDRALVHVIDDGPGVPPEKRDRLFEGDTTIHSTHGLGLSLVRTLAERYGGSVELTATGDAGSTFTVRLPLADAG